MRSRLATVVILLVVGCVPAAPTAPAAMGTIQLEVVAGPVCPVERNPPDPECEPRPVAGARIFVQPGDGRDILVAAATTDERGNASIELTPGDYIIAAGEVEGLMGRPEPTTVTLSADETVTISLSYDTGIR